jgi:hypothetical protein
MHLTGANQRARREQPKQGGQRDPDLFDKYRREQNGRAMFD